MRAAPDLWPADSLDKWQIAIDPKSNTVTVGPWPDVTGWSDGYPEVIGTCGCSWPHSHWSAIADDWHYVVKHRGFDQREAYREFSKIQHFRMFAAYTGRRPRTRSRPELWRLLRPSTRALLRKECVHDRSAALWKARSLLYEHGFSDAEVLKLLKPLPWNKFRGRHNEDALLLGRCNRCAAASPAAARA